MITTEEGKKMKEQLDRIQKTVGTAITWIAQSAVGVLSINDAEKLLRMLEYGGEPQ